MKRAYSLKDVDTDSACAVRASIAEAASSLYEESDAKTIHDLFNIVESLYNGNHPDYQANDTAYHNLEHTLQVTLCWARMIENFHLIEGKKVNCSDYFVKGLAACLFHDAGYLKKRKDAGGTGAKFTHIHEARSCDVAEAILGHLGWDTERIQSVQRMIASTGPRSAINTIPFHDSCEQIVAQMIATADFLAQMSDPDYIKKLPKLYEEFEEFDQTRGLSVSDRDFPSLESLIHQTPKFWKTFVLPRLDTTYGGHYRYLSVPYPNGINPYLKQAEKNMKLIEALANEQQES